MTVNIPNLELLEYQAKLIIKQNKKTMEILKEHFSSKGYKNVLIDLDIEVFSQIWGSTCTGFDVCSDGSPAMSGSAMTKAYTCVFYESISDTYLIFIDGRFCYLVDEPNAKFLKDLKNKRLESLSKAQKMYQ